ncbi:acyltransferase [Methylobacterium sp. WL116]|nr:acyltransferase [Methylobacterium sp. WL116]
MLIYNNPRNIPAKRDVSVAQHIYTLDLLRIFAAILVLLNHFAELKLSSSYYFDSISTAYNFLSIFDGIGSVGVEIFFVISGFVITGSAERGYGKSFAFKFALSRCKRLLPVLWISGLVSLLVRSIDNGFGIDLLIQYVRFAVLFPSGPYIDGVVWSLVVESVFYIVIGFTILSRHPQRFSRLAIILAGMSLFYNIIFIIIYLSVDPYHSIAFAIINNFAFKVVLLKYGIFFALGMFIRSSFKKLNFYVKLTLVPSIFLLCLTEIFISSWNISSFYATIKCSIWVAGVVWLFIVVKYDLPNFLSNRRVKTFVRWLGLISYPLYLNHYILGRFLTEKLESLDSVLRFVVVFFFIVCLSHIIELLATKIISIEFRSKIDVVDKAIN